MTTTTTITTSTVPTSASACLVEHHQTDDHHDGDQHGDRDLDPADRPAALHLAGHAVDAHLEGPAVVDHRQQPDGHQQVLEPHVVPVAVLAVHPLLVAADVLADSAVDLVLHLLAGGL